MLKKFRAFDGDGYWYADDNLIFSKGADMYNLEFAPFELRDLEMFTGKIDTNGNMIYENDLIKSTIPGEEKIFQVIWSDDECGFRKVPHGMPYPETKIDEAFIEVIGTIHS